VGLKRETRKLLTTRRNEMEYMVLPDGSVLAIRNQEDREAAFQTAMEQVRDLTPDVDDLER
jgi:hypothetical protein